MKKIILVTLILCNTLSFGQKVKKPVSTKQKTEVKKRIYLIDKSDFQKIDSNLVVKKSFQYEAGDGKKVDVQTFISANKVALDSLGLEKMNFMLDFANISAKYLVKNKYTYVPRKLALIYSEKRFEWTVKIEFTAQNDMGAIKDSYKFYDFDKKGKNIIK